MVGHGGQERGQRRQGCTVTLTRDHHEAAPEPGVGDVADGNSRSARRQRRGRQQPDRAGSADEVQLDLRVVVTSTLATITLAEFLTPVQVAGGLLVLSSAAVVQLRPGTGGRRDQQVRRPPAHPAAAGRPTVPHLESGDRRRHAARDRRQL